MAQVPDGVELTTSSGSTYTAKQVILACGRESAQKLAPSLRYKHAAQARFGLVFQAHGSWHSLPPQHIELLTSKRFQIIITPLRGGELNVSILCNAQIDKNKLGSTAIRQTLVQEANCFLKNIGFNPEGLTPIGGARSVEYARCTNTLKAVHVIGDARERFDPIGGMGMTHGIYSAIHAVNNITQQTLLSPHVQRTNSRSLFNPFKSDSYTYGSQVLRLNSTLSYSAVTSSNVLLKFMTTRFPALSLRLNKQLKGFFPAPGMKSEMSEAFPSSAPGFLKGNEL
jgi:2-polyprenyl-6-methoxyphenol hydroxylase-like FAD-dependent oxidoreductase